MKEQKVIKQKRNLEVAKELEKQMLLKQREEKRIFDRAKHTHIQQIDDSIEALKFKEIREIQLRKFLEQKNQFFELKAGGVQIKSSDEAVEKRGIYGKVGADVGPTIEGEG